MTLKHTHRQESITFTNQIYSLLYQKRGNCITNPEGSTAFQEVTNNADAYLASAELLRKPIAIALSPDHTLDSTLTKRHRHGRRPSSP